MIGFKEEVDFEAERAAGRLKRTSGRGELRIGPDQVCVGTIDENNIIHWNENATLELLQRALQVMVDFTVWQARRHGLQ